MKKTQTTQHNILHLTHCGDRCVNRVYNKRHVVGFVLHGSLVAYNGTTTTHFSKGDIYFLREGVHYLEHISPSGRPYQEIVIEFSDPLIGSILRDISIAFGVDISLHEKTLSLPFAYEPASHLLRNFFRGLAGYLALDSLDPNGAMMRMKINELLYLIFLSPSSAVRNQLALLACQRQVLFEQIIRENIFGNTSIAHLSLLCNMSPSEFKKQFREHFNDSPHHWCLQQRLAAARSLLLHTSDQVKSIARDCGFASPSHFIRHFHQTYGLTPSEFRHRHIIQSSQSAHSHQATSATTTSPPTSKT